jgi:hypothetical protein
MQAKYLHIKLSIGVSLFLGAYYFLCHGSTGLG